MQLTGVEWTIGLSGLTYVGISSLAQLLNFSMQTAEKLEFIFWFMFSGFAFYYLMKYLTRDRSGISQSIISLTAVNFYMFNLYLESIWRGSKSSISAQALTPLILMFFIKGMEEKKFFKYALLIALVSPFLSMAGANLPVLAVVLMALLAFYLFYPCLDNIYKDRHFF